MTPTPRRMPVYVALPPHTLLLDVAGPLEGAAPGQCDSAAALRFEPHYVAPARKVRSSIGLELGGIEALPRELPEDAMLIVPGNVDDVMAADGSTHNSSERDTSEERRQQQALVDWLRATVRPGHTLVTICSGAILAARAGLLDGYACTTHHLDCTKLAALAPLAQVLDNRLYVEDRGRYSSAGVTAGIDLMLHILAKFTDHACALAIARYLVVYLRRSGSDPQLSPWLEGRSTRPASRTVHVAGAPGFDAIRRRSCAGLEPRRPRPHRQRQPAPSFAAVQRTRRHEHHRLHQPPAHRPGENHEFFDQRRPDLDMDHVSGDSSAAWLCARPDSCAAPGAGCNFQTPATTGARLS